MNEKNSIVIVENSKAIGLLLKNNLEKLGYDQIHNCYTGYEAITTLTDLVNQNKCPIVLLDYMLPDMDAHSVMTQILEIQSDIRIILETATEEDDEGIQELMRTGAYHYIKKPIRFEALKSIIDTIELEDSSISKEDGLDSKLNEALVSSEIKKQVDNLFKTVKQGSINQFIEHVGHDEDIVRDYFVELENKKQIISIGETKEITCNNCSSIKTVQRFFCPSCKSSNFKLGKLIEHYDCGNITEDNTYTDDACPNCKKEIKALGVDYRVMHNHYICNNCREFFPEISSEYLCLKCEHRFLLKDGRWESSKIYKLIDT